MKLIFFYIFLLSSLCFSQRNQDITICDQGKKNGYFILYGKDNPSKGYPENGMIMQGMYLNDRKEGCWVFYYPDGVSPKLEGTFVNGRPFGPYTKYWEDGSVKEEGEFKPGKQSDVHYNIYSDDTAYYSYNSSNKEASNCVFTNYHCDTTVEYSSSNLMRYDSEIHHVNTKEFSKNGYNVVYNSNDEMVFKGKFSYGAFWEGEYYIYDEDGILEKIEIWQSGKYCCDGRL